MVQNFGSYRISVVWKNVGEGDQIAKEKTSKKKFKIEMSDDPGEYEKDKFAKKAREVREEYFQSERLQGTNSAWMTFFFTSGMGLILWYGGWEVIRGDLSAGGLAKFILYLNQLTFPIRMSSFIINSFSRSITRGGN